jgi:ribosomal protein S18 acetylase RimI-like enzyme
MCSTLLALTETGLMSYVRTWLNPRILCVVIELPFMQTVELNLRLPDGARVTLRSVTAADDEFLLKVYASTREAELAQAPWTEEQKEQFLRWQFGLQRKEYDARFPDAKYDVIVVDGTPAGRIWVGSDDQQTRLLDIGILPEFQNRGVGTALVSRLIEQTKQEGKLLRHMVFVLNDDALRFYERLGFVVIEDLDAYKHMEWRAK